jgi:iron complex transport system substrate-binding protein
VHVELPRRPERIVAYVGVAAVLWDSADLILHDTRAFSLQPDRLATFPTWTTLPAVRAGKVGRWSAEVRLSAQGYATALEDLATTVAAARDDVV